MASDTKQRGGRKTPAVKALLLAALVACTTATPATADDQPGPAGMLFAAVPGAGSIGAMQVGTTPVTYGQWVAVMGQIWPHRSDRVDGFPASCISYDWAQQFIVRLNSAPLNDGYTYRLPTSDEWDDLFNLGVLGPAQAFGQFWHVTEWSSDSCDSGSGYWTRGGSSCDLGGRTPTKVCRPPTFEELCHGFRVVRTGGPPAGHPPADFSGDLKSDMLWHHATNGEVWLWGMNGVVRDSETFVRAVPDTTWEIRGFGDQTGDGKADILWRNRVSGQVFLWPMNGSVPIAETYVDTVDTAYDIVGTGDYNGDGKSDMLWRQTTTGEVWIWLMDGVTPLSRVLVDTVDPAFSVAGSGDLDADHKADIVWRHDTLGEVWVWLMNGTTRASQTWVSTVAELDYRIVGVADHTGDGKADLLWHHATRGEVWLWPMNGTTLVSQTYVDTVPDAGYRIVGTGDYDGDTKADLLWHHATRGEVWVWLMDGATPLNRAHVATVPDVGYQIVKLK